MKRQKGKVFLLVFSLLTFLGLVGVLISMNRIDQQTEKNTTEYTATISATQIVDSGRDIYAELFTKEYDTAVYISTNVCKHIDIEQIKGLQNGDKVTFRIEHTKAAQMNQVEFVDAVSLKSEEHSVFSLSDYNAYMKAAARPARIAGVIFAMLFLWISLHLAFSLKAKER